MPSSPLSTLLSYISLSFTDEEAQSGRLTLPGSPSRGQLWLGPSQDWKPGVLTSLRVSLCHCGALAQTTGPTSLSDWDNPHWEGCWQATLSQSRWAFGINSPAVVPRSRSTKGPTAGRDGAGVWAARLHTHSDNQGFQSRSSEIVLAQRAHSQLWSQTIPGGGALRVRGDKRVLSSRPHPRTAGPTLPLHSQLPTCESVMQDSVFKTPSSSKDQRLSCKGLSSLMVKNSLCTHTCLRNII